MFALVSQSCNTDSKKKDGAVTLEALGKADSTEMNHNNMEGMHNMNEMKMTGDFDYDFANTMIDHHQTAVDMAKDIIAKGMNREVKATAQNIVTVQQAEILQFKNILKNYKIAEVKTGDNGEHKELVETMTKMESKMNGMAMTGNANKDFLMMMIPHHESAITMGQYELSHGKNLALKTMAQKIINDQSTEVKQFEAMLEKMK